MPVRTTAGMQSFEASGLYFDFPAEFVL